MGGQPMRDKRWVWGLLTIAVIGSCLMIVGWGRQSQAEPATEDPASAAWTEQERLSYAIGYVIVRRLQERGVPFNIEQVAMGFGDAADHREPKIPAEQMEAAIAKLTGRQAAKEATGTAETAQRAREAMAAAAEREAQQRLDDHRQHGVIQHGRRRASQQRFARPGQRLRQQWLFHRRRRGHTYHRQRQPH